LEFIAAFAGFFCFVAIFEFLPEYGKIMPSHPIHPPHPISDDVCPPASPLSDPYPNASHAANGTII